MVNLMSLATTAIASPAVAGLPAGAGVPAGGAAEAPEQAASTVASASRPRVRVRRFMSIGLQVSVGCGDRYQAAEVATPRRATRFVKAASSLRTTENGLPSWRTKSTATRTIRATSMAFATYAVE